MHHRAALRRTVEFRDTLLRETHRTVHARMDGPVFAEVRVRSRAVPVALLTNDDCASRHTFTTEGFHAPALRSTVSAVGS